MLLLLIALFEGEFFTLGVDAASWGRGSTGLAYPTTGYKNPAAVLILPRGGNFTGSRIFFANLISGGVNFKGENFGIGAHFVFHSVGDIHDTRNALIDLNGNGVLDENEELNESRITNFSSREGAFTTSYARLVGDLSVGLNLKFIYKRIKDQLAFGAGTDIGIIYEMDSYSIGAAIKDLTTSPIFWKGRTEHIAPSYQLGVGMKREVGSIDLLLEVDLIQDDYGFNHHLGLEASINKWLRVRTGFINNQLTAGIGLEKFPFSVNYAVNVHPCLPLGHRISILYNFE